MAAIGPNREALDLKLTKLCEIPPPELDPIEHAVLWLGLHELAACPELPYRVALAEAVQLAKQFGATDGHKFVNAVLDRAAKELRPDEYGQARGIAQRGRRASASRRIRSDPPIFFAHRRRTIRRGVGGGR